MKRKTNEILEFFKRLRQKEDGLPETKTPKYPTARSFDPWKRKFPEITCHDKKQESYLRIINIKNKSHFDVPLRTRTKEEEAKLLSRAKKEVFKVKNNCAYYFMILFNKRLGNGVYLKYNKKEDCAEYFVKGHLLMWPKNKVEINMLTHGIGDAYATAKYFNFFFQWILDIKMWIFDYKKETYG